MNDNTTKDAFLSERASEDQRQIERIFQKVSYRSLQSPYTPIRSGSETG